MLLLHQSITKALSLLRHRARKLHCHSIVKLRGLLWLISMSCGFVLAPSWRALQVQRSKPHTFQLNVTTVLLRFKPSNSSFTLPWRGWVPNLDVGLKTTSLTNITASLLSMDDIDDTFAWTKAIKCRQATNPYANTFIYIFFLDRTRSTSHTFIPNMNLIKSKFMSTT